jgi:hypothetical protein
MKTTHPMLRQILTRHMNTDNFLSRIPPRYWGYLALFIWGCVTLFLLRHDPYSLDEGAAKSLLLVWSIADQIASSVVTFGAPDLRAFLFFPVGFLWTGNIFAAKVFTVLSLAFVAWLFYFWKRHSADAECALLASGLLIISPLALEQIDTLSPGVYLLLAFALGAWLDKAYRTKPFPFGGWYFAQLLVSAFSVSLHPAGMAYPLALLWSWHIEPLDYKQQKYFYFGVGFVVLFTLLVRMGWHDLEWLQNPFNSLAIIALGSSQGDGMTIVRWVAGAFILALLVTVVLKQFRNLWSDFTGRTLLIGLALGATTSDPAWSMIALGIVLYFGFPLLLRSPQSLAGGFVHQRGVVLLFIIILSTLFMRADKVHYEVRQYGILSAQDQLLKTLAEEAENARKAAEENEGGSYPAHLRVASQWPSRTMIACKCDTLPLPPAAQDSQAQLTMLHSITHLLFNPQQPANITLARNLAVLGGAVTETVALQSEGVLLHFKNQNTDDPKNHYPPERN